MKPFQYEQEIQVDREDGIEQGDLGMKSKVIYNNKTKHHLLLDHGPINVIEYFRKRGDNQVACFLKDCLWR